MTYEKRPRATRREHDESSLRRARRAEPPRRPRRHAQRLWALFLVVAMAAVGAFSLAAARASAATSGEAVYLTVGDLIWYGGLGIKGTARMSVNGTVAFCSDPARATPRSGYYAKSAVQTHQTDGVIWPVSSVEKVLFYGYGGPGFDANVWRKSVGGTDLEGRSFDAGLDWDGTEITDDEFYAYTHILVADRMWCSGAVALQGTSDKFKEWFHWNILGYTYGHNGEIENEQAIGPRIEKMTLPGGFEAYQLDTGNNALSGSGARSQTVVSFEYSPYVEVTFTKVSADASLTSGNDEYALAGASYDIFDAQTNEKVASVTTDDSGHAACQLEPNTSYYAIETRAPQGFVVSDGRVEFSTGTGPSSVRLTDQPGTLALTIAKRDSATLGDAQPGATLQGAEFKVVDANGNSHLETTDETGRATFEGLPLGEATVSETRAPVGYKPIEGTWTYEASSGDLPDSGVIELVPDDGYLEDVIAFDLDLVKYRDTGAEGSGLQDPAEGVRFSIVSNTTGDEVGSVTTDENGYASTEGLWFGLGTRPEGVSGALPYDQAGYTVREDPETTPEGYVPAPEWTIGPEQMTDGVTLHYIVDNDFLTARIQVVKTDARTGRNVELAGFSFQLLDADGNPVSQEVWYPNHEVIDVFTTDESGCVTFPGALAPGTYRLREVAAQPPYLLAEKDIEFSVTDPSEMGPLSIITFPDEQASGSATITKRCADGEPDGAGAHFDLGCPGALEGAVYDVVATHDVVGPDGTTHAVAGEVMARVTTDESGTATVNGLPLGSGSATYAFIEAVPPAGHVLDPTPREFTLTYEDDHTAVVLASVEAPNEPTTITLDKRILGTDQAIAGVTFELWSADGSIEGEKDSVRVTTDETGHVTLRHLPAGTYDIREVCAPDGIVIDGSVTTFTIDEDGTVEGSAQHAITIENDYTKLELSKRDVTNEAEVSGAHLTLLDAEGSVVDQWVSGEEPHRIDMVRPGVYTLVEEMTPHTYDLATSVEFVVADTGEIQTVVMYDRPIEVSGELDKRQEIADPTAVLTEADALEGEGGKNRAETSVSEDGRFDYSVDARSTSSTWVDEFTVTDELSGARDGLTELLGITTPAASGDYDGRLNVWYRTTASEGANEVSGEANATLEDGHENPWLSHESNADALGDDGRALSYAGWRLWAADVSATEATELSASDLGLADGERIVSVRLEYGRVEAGFTTRTDDWERDDLKHPHDDLANVSPTHEGDLSDEGFERAPLVVHMRVTGDYREGATITNEARVDLFRNGGREEGLEDHDEDQVEQSPIERDEPGPLAKTGETASPVLATTAIGAAVTFAGLGVRRRR